MKVSAVEVKDVVIPQTMQRSTAGQAEAERERRAKIIAAEGEYQASERLSQAADRLTSPTALPLRLFQTLSEIASEKNSTIILPVPIDLFEPYLRAHSGNTCSTHSGNGSSKSPRAKIGEEEEPWHSPAATDSLCRRNRYRAWLTLLSSQRRSNRAHRQARSSRQLHPLRTSPFPKRVPRAR